MTISANKLKPGIIIKWNNALYKVLETEFRGTGKSAKMVQTKLHDIIKNLNTDHRFNGDEKVEDIKLDREDYQYLYRDGNLFFFMNPTNFEQISLNAEVIGKAAEFLKEETIIQIEFYEDKPVNIALPEFLELKVTTAPPALKDSGTTTYKEITLENGIKILAPQFIEEGATVRVDWAHQKYVDRVKEEKK
ncbi:MAG: elongation factor P [Candidatus Margulisbacteria bacterium]|nr:elongation factor P [Candidatus Margulisiibacteriota bacterium]